jgi:ribonucleoside-diphosphate reductase alpha chain
MKQSKTLYLESIVSNNSHKRNNTEGSLNRTEILRAVVADAESMGIRDRNKIEQLTTQVIERLERQRALPGMEHLVSKYHPQKRPFAEAEIRTAVKEILAAEELSKPEEVKPEMEIKTKEMPVILAKPRIQIAADIKLSDNALRVLKRRYLTKDGEGRVVETPQELFRRVARHIASAELIYNPKADVSSYEEAFYQLMENLEFLPNSPTLMNAGRELGQLSACFVLPIEDSMESIFDAVKYTALIHKSGGGTGFSFSRLRPEGDRVGSTGGIASGPVSFMRAFDTATDVIKQGGMRRGANMAILNVDHPDILKFIEAKADSKAFTNFNLSVAVSDDFMEAVEKDIDYDLINPRTGKVAGKLNAKVVFDRMVDMAWKTGDPGIVFIDRINDKNPVKHLGKIESTNPCGEQPLLPYESCNLGSINLGKMLRAKNGNLEVDEDKLARTVRVAVRFLDNVIDVNHFPLPQIEEKTKLTRKIGLGVMGFADMLIQLGIPYNSEKALYRAEKVMANIQEYATDASKELAKERGVFPAFKGSKYDLDDPKVEVRNATRTTIAPTGTLSIIAGCSSGIEPLFALSYTRTVLDGDRLIEVNPYFEEAAKNGGFYSEELMQKLATGVHLSDIDGVPDEIKRLFVTAHEIAPEWHVKMQAAFQKATHNAISKTVNFPHDATPGDVAKVYMMAYHEGLEGIVGRNDPCPCGSGKKYKDCCREGLKGITIYRDRSRESQVLTVGEGVKRAEGKLAPRKRPKVTTGVTERVNTGCGYIYVTVNFDNRGISEVFSILGKAGGCAAAQLEAISRLTSLALRSGIDVDSIVKHLRGIRCPSIAWEQGHAILSCADAIASVLEKYIKEGTASNSETPSKNPEIVKSWAGQCPDCGGPLIYQEGCNICLACGFTKCG